MRHVNDPLNDPGLPPIGGDATILSIGRGPGRDPGRDLVLRAWRIEEGCNHVNGPRRTTDASDRIPDGGWEAHGGNTGPPGGDDRHHPAPPGVLRRSPGRLRRGQHDALLRGRQPAKHCSPDASVAFGVPKDPNRDLYLVWREGKAPDLVVELTSKSTRKVDEQKKFVLYRDVLKVTEYIMFDPRAEYLDPPLQGFRLINGEYVRIEPVDGRIPSQVLGLHFERDGQKLRLYDPATGTWLQTPREGREAARRTRRGGTPTRRGRASPRRGRASPRRGSGSRTPSGRRGEQRLLARPRGAASDPEVPMRLFGQMS